MQSLPFVLVVVAACCFACAALLQHRAVAVAAEPGAGPDSLPLRGLRDVARSPVWWLGLVLAAGGSTLHAGALVLAPLSVVQPVGVLAMPIAVALAAAYFRRKPTTGMLVGVLLSGLSVLTFVMVAVGSAAGEPASGTETALGAGAVALVVLALAGMATISTGWARCIACAMAGGTAFGLVAALMRAMSQAITAGPDGILELTTVVTVASMVAATLIGGWFIQQAFASGPPEVVVACMTVVDPIVAVMFGVMVLGEGDATSAAQWAVLTVAAIGAVSGIAMLARHHPAATSRGIRTDLAEVLSR